MLAGQLICLMRHEQQQQLVFAATLPKEQSTDSSITSCTVNVFWKRYSQQKVPTDNMWRQGEVGRFLAGSLLRPTFNCS